MPGLKPTRTSASKRKTSPSKAEKSTANSSSSSPAKATQNKDRQEEDGAKEEEERNELLQLAESVAQNAHLLVRGRGDEQLAQLARNVLKRSFDQGACISRRGGCPAPADLRCKQPSNRNRSLSLT
jgi:hypothetical protein